jgi:serine/threonine protein kinase
MSEISESLRAALSGRYELERVLGHGGMATVYLAHDVRHRREVAVKVLRPEVAAALGTDRFLREIQIAANLTHPHILALYDSGRARAGGTTAGPAASATDILFYVMPYIDGESLRDWLTRDGTLRVENALALVEEVSDALSYAHRQGIIHRDIKPENVLLASAHAVVADFGIAKALSSAGGRHLTRTGFPLGTVGYMSPEQAAGSTDLDATTDVFSLACVCYEMLVGEVPGRWVSDADVRQGRFLEAPLSHRPKLNALPRVIEPALVRAMAMRAKDRFRTPNEFNAALTGTAVGLVDRVVASPAANPDIDDAMSITAVERIAAEAGIAPQHVREAARVVEQSNPEDKPTLFRGLSRPLVFERTVSGEVSEEDFPALVEHIRESTGHTGFVTTLGRSLEWRSMEQAASGRLMDPSRGPAQTREVSVTITPRSGQTKIRVEESMERTRLMSLAMGTAGLVPAVLLAGVFSAEAASAWAGISVVAALGTVALGGAMTYVGRLKKGRAAQARRLADRLADEIARSSSTR